MPFHGRRVRDFLGWLTPWMVSGAIVGVLFEAESYRADGAAVARDSLMAFLLGWPAAMIVSPLWSLLAGRPLGLRPSRIVLGAGPLVRTWGTDVPIDLRRVPVVTGFQAWVLNFRYAPAVWRTVAALAFAPAVVMTAVSAVIGSLVLLAAALVCGVFTAYWVHGMRAGLGRDWRAASDGVQSYRCLRLSRSMPTAEPLAFYTECKRLLDETPDDPGILAVAALAASRAGDQDAAVVLSRRRNRVAPPTWLSLNNELVELNAVAEAGGEPPEWADVAVALTSCLRGHEADVAETLGQYEALAGDPVRALRELDACARLMVTDDDEAHRPASRALALTRLGKVEEAEAALRKAGDLAPGDARWPRVRSWMQAVQQP